ncbi:hypothetical protein OC842_005663 [Tilletia horrida]|uniref:Fe2OG dioxygenase domain-containing protein n=1 Tax=Tilletia horrida TaxID=155126 RepID=A0AAN6G9P7_9BASI|nr:hypothetical protein OC842_005663 [Tilletia horrida]
MPWRRYDDEDDGSAVPDEEEDSGSELEGSDTVAGEESGALADLAGALADAPLQRMDFSFGGVADMLPAAPGLFIDGLGSIALPVVDKDKAEAIARVCEQAPFGRGQETLFDTSVRNSWQLNPDKVRLTNPEWAVGIRKAGNLIAQKFGVPEVALSLKLYKLLLYQPGGHFAKHRDTEKEDGMFATMVIQLPSQHEGGSLVVYKDEDSTPTKHDFGAASGSAGFKCHYAVHYADAEHALTPITSGYRLALVYSICWPTACSTPAPSSGLDPDAKQQIADCLNDISLDGRSFHYFLEHAYTQKSMGDLGAAALKGLDRSRLAILRAANAVLDPEEQFVFFLGKAERHTSFYGDSCARSYEDTDWEQLHEPDQSVRQLLNLEGHIISTSTGRLDLGEGDVLNPDRKTVSQLWHGQRSTVYEGYLGNEGPTRDTTYHKYILLAWPRSAGLIGVLGESAAFEALVETRPSVEQMRQFLKQLLSNPLAEHSNKSQQRADIRHKLFRSIVGDGAWYPLIDSYLQLYPTAANLVGSGADTVTDSTHMADMLLLIKMPALWDRPEVRTKVAAAFEDDERRTVSVVFRCMTDMVDASLWQLFVAILERRQQDALPVKPDQSSADVFERRLWWIALRLPDDNLCKLVAQRHLKLPASSLKVCTGTFVGMKNNLVSEYRGRRALLDPIVQARIQWAEGEVEFLGAEARQAYGWQMPRALCPEKPELVSFLRGSERETTTYGFNNLGHARNSAARRNRLPQINCSYTASEGGRGRDAYVTITKTERHFRLCASACAELRTELGTLRMLLQDRGGGGGVSADGPTAEDKENERPPKRSRVSGP